MSDMATTARTIVRSTRRAALATLDAKTGAPFASLVAAATLPRGEPVILISKLARHTANIAADPRASLLFEDTVTGRDILADGRVSLAGTLHVTTNATARTRYLARHTDAEGYADFADFSFYMLEVNDAHLVQGFGKIKTLAASEFLLPEDISKTIAELEQEAIEHMNKEHADALQLYATALCGMPQAEWRAQGVDAEGFDLISPDGHICRFNFPTMAKNGADLRAILAQQAAEARQQMTQSAAPR